MKVCTTCAAEKPLDEFPRGRGQCRPCYSEARRAQRAARGGTKGKDRSYYERNKEKVQARNKAYYERNKERMRQYAKAWREDPANRERVRQYRRERADYIAAQRRESGLRRRYGISGADYDALLADQSGGCFICAAPPPEGGFLDVDHCHTTGRVRGLLCQKCNKAIGLLGDDPLLLARASEYLAVNP